MTIFPLSHANQIAEFGSSRNVHEASENAARLSNWKARYPYDAAEVPSAPNPPEWPIKRVSIDPPLKVTRLRVGQRA